MMSELGFPRGNWHLSYYNTHHTAELRYHQGTSISSYLSLPTLTSLSLHHPSISYDPPPSPHFTLLHHSHHFSAIPFPHLLHPAHTFTLPPLLPLYTSHSHFPLSPPITCTYNSPSLTTFPFHHTPLSSPSPSHPNFHFHTTTTPLPLSFWFLLPQPSHLSPISLYHTHCLPIISPSFTSLSLSTIKPLSLT